MEIQSVFIVMIGVLLMGVGNAAGGLEPVPSPPPPVPQNCHCGSISVVCAEASSLKPADKVIPWITFGLSLFLFTIPSIMRLWRLRADRLGIRHTAFMWHLILNAGDYAFWCWYSKSCKRGQATYPIWLTSIVGCIFHVVLVFLAVFKLSSHAGIRRLLAVLASAGLCGVFGGIFDSAAADATAINGWFGLGLAAVSHFLRIKATDYGNFDRFLFGASVIGVVNGFLWQHHPNLCIARQYKLASHMVGVLRGFEVLLWLWPGIASTVTRVERTEIELAIYAGNRNDNRAASD